MKRELLKIQTCTYSVQASIFSVFHRFAKEAGDISVLHWIKNFEAKIFAQILSVFIQCQSSPFLRALEELKN